MRKKIIALLISIIVVISMLSYTLAYIYEAKQLEFSLEHVRLKKVSLTSITLSIDLSVNNPSIFSYVASDIHYDFYLRNFPLNPWVHMANGTISH